jgi:elongation factor P
MISVNDFKTGITIELEGDLWQVIEFQHVKPGKGAAFVRTKIKNLRKETTVDKTFRGGEKVMRAIVERKPYQYLYAEGDDFVFMNNSSYEQVNVPGTAIGDGLKWLKDSMEVNISFHGDAILGVEMPNFVELKVTQTDPGLKGDTAQGGSKPATVETGAVITVPLFVEEGDILQIDTRSGEYLRRV